jgi:hypothetical protein
MTKTEMQNFYERACTKTNIAPDPGEFRGWFKTFEMFTADDLREALDDWWAGSRFMPAAKELLPAAIASRNRRFARANASQHLVAWRCPECGIGSCGYVSPNDHATRYCKGLPRREKCLPGEICGANLREVLREAVVPARDRKAA